MPIDDDKIRITRDKDGHSIVSRRNEPPKVYKAKEDFRKLLKEEEQDHEMAQKVEGEQTRKETGKSEQKDRPYALTGFQRRGGDEPDDEHPQARSIFDLSSNAAKTEKRPELPENPKPEHVKEFPTPPKEVAKAQPQEIEKPKPRAQTQFVEERPDLSGINQLAAPQQPLAAPAIAPAAPVERPNQTEMQQLVDQIVKSAIILKSEGKTEMTITLKHPPTLENATLTLTTFDTARGEFNVAFGNLTQEGKNLLDRQANQTSLRETMEKQGFALHIVTTTTKEIETPLMAQASPEGTADQQEQQRQQRQKEQDETA
ncbi:MAG: hypothetical protein KDK65_02325 [Chlamydiia bacterium]|nr:hypothetical protein [Chlamydiia bacterium]